MEAIVESISNKRRWDKFRRHAKFGQDAYTPHDPEAPLPDWAACLVRVVVAVDPTITTGSDSDETGIIVAGLDRQARCFILDDLSARMSPDQWGMVAVGAAHRWRARRIICEINQGGELVIGVLRSVDSSLEIVPIRAMKGKVLRAEPVAALYEQGRVFHTRTFPKLEQQMVEWTAHTKKSPDRLDALVYAVSDLMLTPIARTVRWIPSEITAA